MVAAALNLRIAPALRAVRAVCLAAFACRVPVPAPSRR
jgi:hypothetical protein